MKSSHAYGIASALLNLVLLLSPRAFREHYRSEILFDLREQLDDLHGIGIFVAVTSTLLETTLAGFSLRFENAQRLVGVGLRMLTSAPLLSGIAILTIALGVAVNLGIFCVLNALILRPLPFPDSAHLVFINQRTPASLGETLSYFDAKEILGRAHTIATSALVKDSSVSFTRGASPAAISLSAKSVEPAYFSLLGYQPQLGRTLREDSSAVGDDVVISDQLWHRMFASLPDAVGQTMMIDGRTRHIVGVMPQGLIEPAPHGIESAADLWLPIDAVKARTDGRGARDYLVLARIRSGENLNAVNQELSGISNSLSTDDSSNSHRVAYAMGVWSSIFGPEEPVILLVFLAVSFVLLIACSNVTNLLLIRTLARTPELAMRAILGASPGQIALQLLAESAMLVFAGGILGAAVCAYAITFLSSLAANADPFYNGPAFDVTVAEYFIALLIIVTVLTSIAPVITVAKAMRSGPKFASRVGVSKNARRGRQALVVLEVALALVLVASASLVARSFWIVTQVSVGFNPTDLYVGTIERSVPDQLAKPESNALAGQKILSLLSAESGVAGAAISWTIPFDSENHGGVLRIPGRPSSSDSLALVNSVSPSYFNVLQIKVLAGRAFADGDRPGSLPVVVVSKSLAIKYFGSLDVIGRQLAVTSARLKLPSKLSTIVGVVDDMRMSYRSIAPPEVYFPAAQFPVLRQIVVRSSTSAFGAAGAISQAVGAGDPSLVSPSVSSFQSILGGYTESLDITARVLAGIAVVGLILASAGIYGVLSFNVDRRTQEFGIRMALGASPLEMIRIVIQEGATLAGFGFVFGVLLLCGASFGLNSFLIGISTFDPVSILGSMVAIGLVVLLASVLPSLRAMRIDPAAALRSE